MCTASIILTITCCAMFALNAISIRRIQDKNRQIDKLKKELDKLKKELENHEQHYKITLSWDD